MGDAVIALTTNVAIQRSMRGEPGHITFDEKWFERDADDTPDGSSVVEETERLNNFKIV
jgi:hypothetical protein